MSTEISPVVKTISLDFARKTAPITVFAKQGDNLSRKIIIRPTLNGVPVSLDYSYGFLPYFAEKKPDGKYVYVDSVSIEGDGTLLLTLTDQSLAAHGNATCCIVLKGKDNGEILTSQNFILNIEFSAGAYENLASSDEILGIDGKLEEVNKLIEDIESMLGEGVFNAKSIPHMRFSAYADGTDFSTTWSAGMNYIGFAIAETAPAQKEEYTWAQFASNVRDTVRVTLKADAWENNLQTVDCKAILEKSSAWSSYAPDYKIEYINYGVSIKSASVGKATFECVTTPSVDIDVMLTITDPLAAAGSADVPDGEQPTDSKYVMRDQEGNLSAFTPDHMAYPNLLYSYTHEQNKEVYPTALNLATGEWTAVGHGLTQNQQVFVALHPPYHIIGSYDQLPGGLLLGPTAGGGLNAQKYYVNVVDADTFTLSETSGGAVKTYTEVATMDLSRFHFEVFVQQVINIDNLPDLTELLVVVNGRVSNGYRYCRPDGRSHPQGKVPAGGFDKAYVDNYGSMFMGNGGGWGSLYATIEMKYVEARHLLITYNIDTMCYKTDGVPIANHERAYIHNYMTVDAIKKLSFQQGQFMNGTTVEVYSK